MGNIPGTGIFRNTHQDYNNQESGIACGTVYSVQDSWSNSKGCGYKSRCCQHVLSWGKVLNCLSLYPGIKGACSDHFWDLPSKLRFWYKKKAHIFFIICAKFQAKVMLRSEDMSVKVVDYLKFCIQNCQVISSNSLLFRLYLLNPTSLWTEILYSLSEKYGLSSDTKIWVELHQDYNI